MAQSVKVLITGAGSGIGLSMVREWLNRGAEVYGLELDPKRVQELQVLIDSKGSGKGRAFQVDVTDALAYSKVAEEVRHLAQDDLNVWVNNAGISKLGSFESLSDKDFNSVMAVCFHAVVTGVRLAQLAFHAHSKGAGTIVNVSSLSGLIAAPFMSPYVAAKHAMVGLTRSLQLEAEQTGSKIIYCLACPGFVRTPIIEGHPGFEFPKNLSWLLAEPESVAQEIVRAVEMGRTEVIPTAHGKILAHLNRAFPKWIPRTSRLLTRS